MDTVHDPRGHPPVDVPGGADWTAFYDRRRIDPVLRTLLLERLATADLDAEAKRVIEVACEAGEAPSDRGAAGVAALGDRRGLPRDRRAGDADARAGPGLTVVVGRNGSGKSSFAEGLELLMTGRLKRWEKRPKAWTETWQCLHHEASTRIAAELVLEGNADVALAQEWAHGAPHDDASGRAPAQAVLAEHGWDRDLPSFRPFLSYAELATMFDTLSSLYEALTPVLGLADIDELAGQLAAARLAYDNQRKTVSQAREGLIARLDPDDEHAALVAAALQGPQAGPRRARRNCSRTPRTTAATPRCCAASPACMCPPDEEIGEAFTALRVAERAHKDAAKTDARRATQVAALLRQALAVRDPERLTDDCPVCGTADVLDEAWAARAAEQAAALSAQAEALTSAERAVAAARRRAGDACSTRPPTPRRARAQALRAGASRRAPDRPPRDAPPAARRAADARVRRRAHRPRRRRSAAAHAARARRHAPTAELARARRRLAGALRPRRGLARERARGRGPRDHAEGAQGRREVGQGRGRGAAGASASRRSPSARSRTGASSDKARASICTTSRSRSPGAAAARTSTSAPTARARTRSA